MIIVENEKRIASRRFLLGAEETVIKRNRKYQTFISEIPLFFRSSAMWARNCPTSHTMSAPRPEWPMSAMMGNVLLSRGTTWVACDDRLTSLLSVLLSLFFSNTIGIILGLILLLTLLTYGPSSLRLALLHFPIVACTHLETIPGTIRSYEGIQSVYLGLPKPWPGFTQTSSS